MDNQHPISKDTSLPNHAGARRWLRFLLQVLLGIAACLATLLILIRIFYPLPQMVDSYVSSGYTPTPLPPTNTRPPTQTKTQTPTVTSSPTPTSTPLPASQFQVDLTALNPDPPIYGISGVVLNDDSALTIEPPFTDIQWTNSSTIAEQIGREIPEPYHATFGPGAATWKMDVPLAPGYYEILVLDTLYSSGGILDFKVILGDTALTPIVGSSRLEYRSSRGNPPQIFDLWRSIGIYQIDNKEILSVSTSWELRDEQTIVAIDRVLLLQLSYAEDEILSKIPAKSAIYLVDDQEIVLDSEQYWEIRENLVSWGRSFHLSKNPPIDINVTWVLPDPIPVATYEMWVWVPEIHGTIEMTYQLFVEGNEITQTDKSTSVSITPGTNPNGSWIKAGVWIIPERFGTEIQLTILMSVKGNSIGDVAADVIALIPVTE